MVTSSPKGRLVLSEHHQGITTLTMNLPARLNGWTEQMIASLMEALDQAAKDEETKVVILTGADPYYSAGVNLGGGMPLQHPKKLRAFIVEKNKALFDSFLSFPKPILAAVNGPAIGASVTTATLCDGLIASERATFSTPFSALGVPPEGCSSILFAELMGPVSAERMLGPEGWKPTGSEAKECGLAQWLAPHEKLLEEATRIAQGWIAEGKAREHRGPFSLEKLQATNAAESEQVADAFLSVPFLRGQYQFLWRKKKRAPAAAFFTVRILRPLWSRLL